VEVVAWIDDEAGNLRNQSKSLVAGACFEAIHNAFAAWLVRRWVLPRN
jgi:hypothetical protein